MIKSQYLLPEFYIRKYPICDICNKELVKQSYELMTNPVTYVYKCPNCNKEYNYREDELRGEWKWRTI